MKRRAQRMRQEYEKRMQTTRDNTKKKSAEDRSSSSRRVDYKEQVERTDNKCTIRPSITVTVDKNGVSFESLPELGKIPKHTEKKATASKKEASRTSSSAIKAKCRMAMPMQACMRIFHDT